MNNNHDRGNNVDDDYNNVLISLENPPQSH